MAVVDGGVIVGKTLKDLKVKYVFSVNGGHVFPILANLRNNDIKLIHMRHEQACAYAADAWARITGTPGVCLVTAGCGLTNAVTGLCVAGLTNSAVVCISGQHPVQTDGAGEFQEAYGSEICQSFSKFTKRVLNWSRIGLDLRAAFREAITPPQGATLVEIPGDVLFQQMDEANQFPGAKVYEIDQLRSQGDPRHVKEVVDLLWAAERPLLVGGDGIFWSAAAAELKELAELTQTPVYTRRAGQGAVPESHPLAVRGAYKKPFTSSADVIVAAGFRFWSGEKFGMPPTWSMEAKWVQIDASADRVGIHVPAQVPIVGDPKLVLRQIIDEIKSRKLDFSKRKDSAWVKQVAKHKEEFLAKLESRSSKVLGNVPIHPDALMRGVAKVMDKDATVILDSFTMSGYVGHWVPAEFMGQIVDAGPLAPVGHSIGMAIGVQLARPGKQVIAVCGDGGLGIGGFDMETAAKYKLPVCCVLWNNSSWGPTFEEHEILKGKTDPFDMLPNIRYDKIFAELGCHTEFVEKPDQIEPAIRRALSSGKTSLVNVIGDKSIGHLSLGGNLLGSTQIG